MTRRTRKASTEGYRHCPTCDRQLVLDDFGWRNKENNLRRAICKDCRNLSRWILRRVKYERGQLLQKQGALCAICDVPDAQSKLSIDHNHKTQEIRGLLCHDCNTGIALFDESTTYLQRAIAYLRGAQFDTNGIYIPSNYTSNTTDAAGIRSETGRAIRCEMYGQALD